MNREALVKRTAIAGAAIQAACIRIADEFGAPEELKTRIRAPFGKGEARNCNMVEAAAEVLALIAPPVAVDSVAEVPTPATEAPEPVTVEPEAEAEAAPAAPDAPTPRTGSGKRR